MRAFFLFPRDEPQQPRPEGSWSRHSDLFLAAGVIGIVALIVLPLPLLLIDLLVAFNLILGVLLLLMAIYVRSPLEFSVFPSVLLMSTLFRLALAIATTRMLLLHGQAGHIIDAFGRTVAGGNLVVGSVVFLIVTAVQFLVIAKGSERVAEVAARFTLDAMPGKQLSIDSDLRSGLIDKDEARRRRQDLEAESKLHGHLDGAMKFVKGDAIAGLLVILINLAGGMAVGMGQQGMPLAQAATNYSLLAIGDGMVSQIPALLAAMSAGLIVTRSSDARDRHLADAMRKQFAAKPRALLVAGGISALLALLPGFPALVFLFLALISSAWGVLLTPSLLEQLQRLMPWLAASQASRGHAASQRMRLPAGAAPPLLLEMPPADTGSLGPASLSVALDDAVNQLRQSRGWPLPDVQIGSLPDGVPANGWRLLAFDAPIAAGSQPDVRSSADLARSVSAALGRHAGLFIGIQETQELLKHLSSAQPEAVKEVLRAMPLQRLSDVLRRLVEEGVSLRPLRHAIEAFADLGHREKDVASLVEHARLAMRRQLCHGLAPQGALRAALLRPAVESALREHMRHEQGVARVAVHPQWAMRLNDQVRSSIETHAISALLTPPDLRRAMRQLIEVDCFELPVLSYPELVPGLEIQVVDHIGLPADAPSFVTDASVTSSNDPQ